MARATRDAKLENRSNRLKLESGQRFARTISKGIALVYRRTTESYGTWSVRALGDDGKYRLDAIGAADDHADANGIDVLDYFQAQDKARQVARQLVHGDTLEGRKLTVKDAATRYMEWFQQHRKGFDYTRVTLEAHILPKLGGKLVRDLRTPVLRKWLNDLAAKPVRLRTRKGKAQRFAPKPKTDEERRARQASANRVLTILKAILNKAYDDELVSEKAAWDRVSPFPNADEPIVRFLSQDESKRLLNACPADLRALTHGGLLTGARYGELARLRVSDVNAVTRHVHIVPGKTGKARAVPLSAEGVAFFSAQVAGKAGDDLVFHKSDGTAWGRNHQVRAFEAATEAAKIFPAISFHDLRHTYASTLAQAGCTLQVIAKLLGHTSTRMTERHYAHLCDRQLSDAVAAMPNYGFEPSGKVVPIRARKKA